METIKEEKKADLEQLLNSLIEKGWKPRGKYEMEYQYMLGGKEHGFYDLYFIRGNYPVRVPIKHSLRELVSKESGLWQFCVENNLIDYSGVRAYGISFAPLEIRDAGEMMNYDNVHRLLWDTASLDEDKLEDFILQNVKIGEN